MPNPSDDELAELLRTADRVAVVGLSVDPERTSHRIATYLARAGYDVVGVNPVYAGEHVEEIPIVPDLDQAGAVDIVDVFRRAEHVSEYTDQVLDLAPDARPRAFWMQLGIRNQTEADRLTDEGLEVVQDRCIMVEHGRLVKRP